MFNDLLKGVNLVGYADAVVILNCVGIIIVLLFSIYIKASLLKMNI
jgi:hypothetical protein